MDSLGIKTMNAIQISGLKKTYKNGFTSLRGIDLTISNGDFFALLGPNGAGKSTTIGIVSGLINFTAGKVTIYGHNIKTESELAKSMLGIVPQEVNFSLFETCLEIVSNQGGYYGLPRALATARAEKYLKLLNLWDKHNTMSRLLSGGLKRRLMIARALVHEPKILILDEPTAGIDVESRRETWEILTKLNKAGTTILLTTHYLEEAEKLCNRIAIIDRGEIVRNAPLQTLLQDIQTESFVLELREEATTLPELEGFRFHRLDGLTIEVEVQRDRDIEELFISLGKHGIKVRTLRNKSNRLETLFFSLVEK